MKSVTADVDPVRVALVGIGNCASALVQGAHWYVEDDAQPGLMHPVIAGLRPRDVRFVAAFDVDRRKVGKDLSVAIHAPPNCTRRFADVPHLGVDVLRPPVMDGAGESLRQIVEVSDGHGAIAQHGVRDALDEADAEVVVNFLPVGSEQATRWWAQRALDAGCAFVNCIPAFIANDENWRRAFAVAGLPLVGDDVKSQVGATIVHRILAALVGERGAQLLRTYQLNFGGNGDFLNMLDESRLTSKRQSKTGAVTDVAPGLDPAMIHVSPSDHVEWLGDRKLAYIRLEAEGWGGSPMSMELRLDVWDSPNSAGVVIDAVRIAGAALRQGVGGVLDDACAYLMKSPPNHAADDGGARRSLDAFIEQLGEGSG